MRCVVVLHRCLHGNWHIVSTYFYLWLNSTFNKKTTNSWCFSYNFSLICTKASKSRYVSKTNQNHVWIVCTFYPILNYKNLSLVTCKCLIWGLMLVHLFLVKKIILWKKTPSNWHYSTKRLRYIPWWYIC